MADHFTPRNRLEWLNTIQRYFEGELSSQELQSFNAALQESAALRRLFLNYSQQSSAMMEVLGVRSYDSIQSLDPADDDDLDWVTKLETENQHSAQADDFDRKSITARQFLSITGYMLGQVLTSKPAYKTYGIAAGVILAITLIFVFIGGGEAPTGPFAGQVPGVDAQNDPPSVSPEVVATLTAQHDAQWASDAPTTGAALASGQRLTLTHGLAEVTTSSGAVAIVQAPTTIELINDNALRLYRGRLVGRCETPGSKGFVVETPTARVIDLGTEFGVSVDDMGTTDTHVFSGEVALSQARATDGNNAQLLTEGMARRVSADGSRIEEIAAAPYRFVRGMREQDRDPMRDYAAAVLASRPVVYYRFESIGQGGKVLNEAADTYHGQVVDKVTIERAETGNAGRFGAGHIELTDTIRELNLSDTYTLECWVRPDRYHHGSVLTLVADLDEDNRGEQVICGINVHPPSGVMADDLPNCLRFLHRNKPGRVGGFKLQVPYEPTRWMHVVAVKTDDQLLLYINGERVEAVRNPKRFLKQQFATVIGINAPVSDDRDQSRAFDGLIDEVSIYDRAISMDEAARHYTQAKAYMQSPNRSVRPRLHQKD